MQIDRVKLITEMAKKRLKTTDLCTRTNISRATICAIRSGKSCAPTTAQAIADALGVDISVILEAEAS